MSENMLAIYRTLDDSRIKMDSPHSHFVHSNQVTVKSILAKLMAMENITVVQDARARTALFHTKDRVLILPKWNGMTPDIYTLLTCHEVGHAIHTPDTSFKKLRGKRPAVYIDILQIVEDARIEKKMKRKFPGINKSFRIGYKEMIQLGVMSMPPIESFFDDAGKLMGRTFLDRLLIHTKAGNYIDFKVPFLDEEIPLVYGAEEVETFEQVEEVSRAILKYILKFKDKNQQKQTSNTKDSEEFGGGHSVDSGSSDEEEEQEQGEGGDSDDEDESSGSDEGEQEEQEETQNSSGGNKEEDEDGGDDENEENDDGESESKESLDSDKDEGDDDEDESLDGGNGGDEGEEEDEEQELTPEEAEALASQLLKSLKEQLSDRTEAGEDDDKEDQSNSKDEDSFQEHDDSSFSSSHRDYDDDYYGEVTFDASRVSADQFVNHYREANVELFEQMYSKLGADDKANLESSLKSFINRTSKVVNTMVMEFNLKRAARDTKRIAVSRKGVLDTDRLHAYRHSDNIFKSHMVTKTGKNHGVIIFLDQSGSMDSCILYSILQLFNLVMFCQGVKIPFEVYGFCDGGPLNSLGSSGAIGVRKDLILNNYFSSRMSQMEINFAMRNLLLYGLSNDRFGKGKLSRVPATPKNHRLGGTPLDATILVTKDLFWKFKSQNKLDIVHCIYITDGCSDHGVVTGSIYSTPALILKNGPFIYPYGNDTGKSTPGDVALPDYKTTESVLDVLRDETDCKAISFFLCNSSSYMSGCRDYTKMPHQERQKAEIEFSNRGYVEIPSCYDKMFIVNPSLLAFEEGTGSDVFQNQLKARPFLSSFIQVISKA